MNRILRVTLVTLVIVLGAILFSYLLVTCTPDPPEKPDKTVEVTVDKTVPGPERTVETTVEKTVPGPERTIVVEKTVPGEITILPPTGGEE